MPEWFQCEGVENVLDRLQAAGATALATSPYLLEVAPAGKARANLCRTATPVVCGRLTGFCGGCARDVGPHGACPTFDGGVSAGSLIPPLAIGIPGRCYRWTRVCNCAWASASRVPAHRRTGMFMNPWARRNSSTPPSTARTCRKRSTTGRNGRALNRSAQRRHVLPYAAAGLGQLLVVDHQAHAQKPFGRRSEGLGVEQRHAGLAKQSPGYIG